MEMEYDPPPGQPDPPLTEQPSTHFGWIIGLLLLAAIVGYVAHYLGWWL
jgi:hypothetical protein